MEKKSRIQHEILAVLKQLKGQTTKVFADIRALFGSKQHHFNGKQTVVKPLKEGVADSTEEVSDIQTSVAKELSWMCGIISKSWDTSLAVEVTNTVAKADIVLDDGITVLAKDVPATALLELEKSLAELQVTAQTIPTLDPTKGFVPDDTKKNVYKAREVTKTRTKKEKVTITKAPATDKFPAQVELIDQDVPVATLIEQSWSSAITPATKADVITRIEELIRAVKRARSKANSVAVPDVEPMAMKLLGYAFGDLVK